MISSNVIPLYRRHAAAFDRARARTLFERGWLERFLCAMPADGRVLDLGCGTGEPIARWLVENGRAVTGVDATPGMIALCRARLPGETWIVADMRALDLRAMFGIFARHAGPGTVLMFTSGPAAGEAIGRFEGEPLYHASLDPDEYRGLLGEAGFAVLDYRAEDPDCDGHTVWLARSGRR
ncbi:MAG: class I SAM-dependent DNA methyltransferase [Alphaproteobacteria bacterium]